MGRPEARLPNESIPAQKVHGNVEEHSLQTVRPCFLEGYPTDRGHEIEPVGRQTQLDDSIRRTEIGLLNSQCIKGSAETSQRCPDPLGVGRGRLHPEIEITRHPRHTMRRQSVGAHDEEPYPRRRELRQQVPKIRNHALSRWSANVARTAGIVARV